MEDLVIIGILAVVILAAVLTVLRRSRSQSSCCGSAAYKARRKRLSSVAAKRTALVEGMHCQHCVNRVMEAVNDIDGASAQVSLSKGQVVISMERPMEDEVFKSAIERCGYTVTGFR